MVPHLDTVATVRSLEHELALRSIEQRRRLAAPRTVFLPLACLLTLVTGGVLVILTLTLSAPARPVAAATSPAEAIATVRAFYAAANEVLRTGNPAPLDVVVGPDLVEHADRPGLPSGQPGLVRYLSALRAAYPTLRFEVDDFLADNDQVSARVTATIDQGRSVLDQSADHAGIWRGVDLFRIEDGRVAERWSGSDAPSLVQPLARVPLERWLSGSSMTAAAHIPLAPGAETNRVAWPGPGLLVIESGELAVRGSGAAQVFQGLVEPVASKAVVPPGTERVLGSGDVITFPAGTAVLSLRNDGTEPVATLAVAWLPFQDGVVSPPGNEQGLNARQSVQSSAPVEPPGASPGAPTSQGALISAMIPLVEGGRALDDPGITVTPLGRLGPIGAAQLPPGPVVVTLDRVLLAPGVGLPPHPAQGPTLLALEVGALGLVPARELAHVWSGSGKQAIANTGLDIRLSTGDTAWWDVGAVALLRGGDTAGSALLLTITSDAPVRPLP